MSPSHSLRQTVLMVLTVVVVGLAIRFPGAMPGPRVVSAMDHLTVHPLYQEAGATEHGRVSHPHLSDPALQLAALEKRTVTSLRAGRAPLWNPDIYGGAPLLGDGQSRPLSPVTLFKVLLPGLPGVAQDLGVAWLFFWCTLGTALLARRTVEAPLPALAVAAAAALTSPYLSVWLLHPHASTVVWLPWCLLAIERNRLWAVVFVTIGLWTGGHPGTTLHVALVAATWWLLRSRSPVPVAGAAIGALLAAPLWAPLWEQVGRSTTLTARVGGTLEPTQLLDLLWPGLLGHPAAETWTGSGAWADGQLHPGLATMALGLLGLADRSHRRLATGLALAVLLSLVLSITGLPGPVAHGRLGSLLALAWTLLAVIGTVRWAEKAPRWVWLAPALVLGTGTAARWNDQATLSAAEHARAPAEWVSTVRDAAGQGRILGLNWAAQPNTAALADLRDLRGYDLPVSVETHMLMNTLADRPRGPWYPVDTLPDLNWLAWWDVRVVLAFPEQASTAGPLLEAAGWTPLPLPADAPLLGWSADSPGPSAWLAARTEPVTSTRQAVAVVTAADGARSPVPVAASAVRLTADRAAQPVQRTWDGAGRMLLSWTAADVPSMLVVSEAWAPGWRARLSGATSVAPMQLATLQLGVPIPAGVSEAELYYRPDGWIWGQRLFWLGLLALLTTAVASRWRRRSPSA